MTNLSNHPEFVIESLVKRGKDMLNKQQLNRFNEQTKEITDIYTLLEELNKFLSLVNEEEESYYTRSGYSQKKEQ